MSRARILPLLDHIRRDGDASLAALAARAGRSRFELHRVFRRFAGETPKQYALRVRLDRAAVDLLRQGATILDVALAAGAPIILETPAEGLADDVAYLKEALA